MKWIGRLLGLLAVLVVLAVVVAVYLVVTFDPNLYKDRIEDKVAEVTGRALTLGGNIELTLYPSIGLRLEDVRLANADGFGEQPFAEFRVVDVAVAVLPLLRNEIDVQRIEADGVGISLARNADGRTNWDDLVERVNDSGEGAVGAARSGSVARATTGMRDIGIAGLDLTDLRVEWDDQLEGQRMVLSQANLALRGFRLATETPVTFDGAVWVRDGDAEPIELDLDLEARMNLDIAAERYSFRRLQSVIDLRHPALEPEIQVRLDADAMLDLQQAVASVERLSANLSDLHLTGSVEMRGLDDEVPALQGELQSNTFNARDLLASLGFDAPETADPDVLKRVALEFSVSGTPERLTVDPILITLDDSTLRGQAGLDRSGSRPMVSFTMMGDQVDLDRYLPPQVEEAREAETPPELPSELPPEVAKGDIPIGLPAELMRAFDMDGSLRLEVLTMLGLTLEGIEVKLRAREGQWQVDPLVGRGYQGLLESKITLNARRGTPSYAANVRLEGIAIGELLEALRGEESKLLGTGNLGLDITATGASVDALTASLNGTGQMRFEDGAVRGINIARIIRHADARLRGERPEDDGEPNQTDFTELSGSFRIDDGVVHNDDLAASSPLLRVSGRGSADLPRQSLDYRVETTLVDTIEGQGGRSLEELRGVNLPIRISGTFDEPRFRLDLEDVVRERIDERVRRETDRLQQRLLERLGGGDRGDSGGEGGQEQPDEEPSGSRGLDQGLDLLREQGRSLFR